MTLRHDVSQRARDDIRAIWIAIAVHDLAAADRVCDAIERVFLLLAEFPRVGQLRPEYGPAVRSFSVRPYLYTVYYHAHEDRIEIVHVLHGRQDAECILRESQR